MQCIKIWMLAIVACCIGLQAKAQDTVQTSVPAEDTLARVDTVPEVPAQKFDGIYQWRVGIDLMRIGFNFSNPQRQGFDLQADYRDRNVHYWAAEAGFGKGKIDYGHLSYNATNAYLRIGVDQAMLKPERRTDFDIVFIGARYGAAFGQRSEATYTFDSPFGGEYTGTQPAQSYFVHWGEVLFGMKLEVWKRCFMGWTVRGKFLFNGGIFKEITPDYIAGYGSADKPTTFDVNLYLSYALFRYSR